MSENSKIEWTDATWNPLRGCSKVSEGCRNCYAIKTAHRFHKEGEAFEGLTEMTAAGLNWTGKVMLVPDKLTDPLHWREPKRIFVNSMSDLFHKDVPNDFIDKVFATMCFAPQHTYQILTKRPERMRDYLLQAKVPCHVCMGVGDCPYCYGGKQSWKEHPYYNVWLGTSVENQKAADERIPLLLQTPAAVRFLSCEPLLGAVDLTKWMCQDGMNCNKSEWLVRHTCHDNLIDLVIVGGESGPGARPMHPMWARSLRDQCQDAGVAFFFKQWGEWWPYPDEINEVSIKRNFKPTKKVTVFEGWCFERNGKKQSGRMLDGRTWDEFPEVQR